MRQTKVFSTLSLLKTTQIAERGELMRLGGSSHPELSDKIAERLCMQLGDVALGEFSNGEKSVEIRSSLGVV